MAHFDLTDFEWSVIHPLLPTKARGVPRVDDRRVLNGIFWRLRRRTVGRHPQSLRAAHHLRKPLQPLAQSRRMGAGAAQVIRNAPNFPIETLGSGSGAIILELFNAAIHRATPVERAATRGVP
jgi:hypothetical protein